MATEWDGLAEHPAWQKIVRQLTDERRDLFERLIQTAAVSADAAVRSLAQEILRIEKTLAIPYEEREREHRDSDETAGT